MTGVAMISGSMGPKRLELLRELLSPETRLAALINPTSHITPAQTRDVLEASRHVGRPVEILNASTHTEIEAAFVALGRARPIALLVASDPFFNSQREQIVALAARHSIPAIYEWREFVEAGGLMSYGTSLTDVYRQAGVYMGRILQGAKPADLPVLQETKLELVINLRIAKALGLSVPPALLAQTDEVIE
jgi:putative ABC transport system substrate-binding protein